MFAWIAPKTGHTYNIGPWHRPAVSPAVLRYGTPSRTPSGYWMVGIHWDWIADRLAASIACACRIHVPWMRVEAEDVRRILLLDEALRVSEHFVRTVAANAAATLVWVQMVGSAENHKAHYEVYAELHRIASVERQAIDPDRYALDPDRDERLFDLADQVSEDVRDYVDRYP